MGDDALWQLIVNYFNSGTPLPDAIHRQALARFREYLLCGGMPKVVDTYMYSKSFAQVDQEKRNILVLYENDISKFQGQNLSIIQEMFRAIPSALSHDMK